MTAISEKAFVQAPLASANRLLQTFFDENTDGTGLQARILLSVGDIQQPAIVSLQAVRRPEDMTPRYRVHWEADGGGAYPVFDGELTVGGDDDYNAFLLRLEGGYVPPGGTAGRIFDAVVGHRLAESTARTLLRQIGATIESHFNTEETVKAAAAGSRE